MFDFSPRFPLAIVITKLSRTAFEVSVEVDQIRQFADVTVVAGY